MPKATRPNATVRRSSAISSETIAELPQAESHVRSGARIETQLRDGTALIGSDFHLVPGQPPTTAFRAFVALCQKLRPALVIANGDVLDGSSVGRWPRSGWEQRPQLKDEIAEAQARLRDIEKAAPRAGLHWLRGNHDARYSSALSNRCPEYEGILGVELSDHFSDRWQHSWALTINDEVVVKHRMAGGAQCAYNNAVKSGKTVACGHTHALNITPYTDWTGTRYGIDCGTLANPQSHLFENYLEGQVPDWRSGGVCLTFAAGSLMPPELFQVVTEHPEPGFGKVWWRGKLVAC